MIFTKVPQRGNVKTRLQKKFPAYVVEEIYTAFLLDTVAKLEEFNPYIAFYPERLMTNLWYILGDRRYLAQRGVDFGERLANAFNDFYMNRIVNVVVCGCDVPLLQKSHVEQAFQLMADHDLVVGPSNDGGFYLIGGRGVSPKLFEGVLWGQPSVFARVVENAEKLGLKVASTPKLLDVDTPDDLQRIWESGELDTGSKTFEKLKKYM